jgi:hypothetical protein
MNKSKLISILAALLMFSAPCFALDTDVWLSSNTQTADTTKNLCPGIPYTVASSSFTSVTYTSGNHGIFHGACVNNGVAAGLLTVYNSSATATVPIATIATSTAMPCSFYDVAVSSGLTYTNSTTANVTILYQCM